MDEHRVGRQPFDQSAKLVRLLVGNDHEGDTRSHDDRMVSGSGPDRAVRRITVQLGKGGESSGPSGTGW